MDWKNAGKDKLPAHKQKVLIAVKDVKHVAIYDAEARGFFSADVYENFFSLAENIIYWTELNNTDKTNKSS